ncbi:choice-of-anchor B family protein [Flavobacteriaceae bacterium]|jgi:choice-of-anchor B domain-containing protein|nr:choice-of-anchor B family protein [Flavobacteriaceae bacterium]MDA9680565.1 choice-of-anchor B family protein [Flavobacteriaceae bacterium]
MKKSFLIISVFVFACAKELPELPQIIDDIPLEPNPLQSVIDLSGTPCDNGMAGIYPCQGYDLLAKISLETFGSEAANDNWGWVDHESGKEYVLSGLDDGTAFIDISDPKNPIFLGKLPTATTVSPWRDIKVYENHAFIVSEAPEHGLQVFDLTRLRLIDEFQIFTSDARLTDFGNAHNIWINQESGYAYVFGSELYQGGPLFINITNPINPQVEGGYADDSYTHDAHIVTYDGPDNQYKGREILFGSNSDGGENNKIIIVDITDKSNPIRINSITYTNGGYTHQGFLSEDHRYFFLGDELDELQSGAPTQTRIFDLTSLSNSTLHVNYFGGVNAIDHNGYVKGNKFYLASYTAGLRVLDISQVQNKSVKEIGFFDTYPSNNNPKFNGVWSIYPFFESGIIAINDIDSGLFLVKASDE